MSSSAAPKIDIYEILDIADGLLYEEKHEKRKNTALTDD